MVALAGDNTISLKGDSQPYMVALV